MTDEAHDRTLDRVRKLLAKAEAEGCTVAEAQALTAKAAELMAKYGIDRALLDATKPVKDVPSNRIIMIPNPWARVQAHLLCGLAKALRCDAILLPAKSGQRVHLFGYESDLEMLDVLYTSLLHQQAHAFVRTAVPAEVDSARAWRRSWLLGWCSAVIAKVKAANETAVKQAAQERGTGAELVLADRSLVIRQHVKAEYPHLRKAKVTYTGSGYAKGHAEGRKANIGGTSVGRRTAGALTG